MLGLGAGKYLLVLASHRDAFIMGPFLRVFCCPSAFADHAGKGANTKVCCLGREGLPFGLDCGLHANPVEANGISQTRGIRPLFATRSIGPLLLIRGVGPHSWKGSRIDIEKAAVWQ